MFESVWNPAIAHLATRHISREDKLAIAGYLANLLVCTPAWRRISIKGSNADLLHTLRAHDALNTKHGTPDPKIKAALDSGKFELDRDHERLHPKVLLFAHAGTPTGFGSALASFSSSWI